MTIPFGKRTAQITCSARPASPPTHAGPAYVQVASCTIPCPPATDSSRVDTMAPLSSRTPSSWTLLALLLIVVTPATYVVALLPLALLRRLREHRAARDRASTWPPGGPPTPASASTGTTGWRRSSPPTITKATGQPLPGCSPPPPTATVSAPFTTTPMSGPSSRSAPWRLPGPRRRRRRTSATRRERRGRCGHRPGPLQRRAANAGP